MATKVKYIKSNTEGELIGVQVAQMDTTGSNITEKYAAKVDLTDYVPVAGGTMTGDLNIRQTDSSTASMLNLGVGSLQLSGIYSTGVGSILSGTGLSINSGNAGGNVTIENITVPKGTTGKTFATTDQIPDISNKADLVDGQVPASQLPSYVDDVIEYTKQITGTDSETVSKVLAEAVGSIVYNNSSTSTSPTYGKKFVKNVDGTQANIQVISPESGKIYIRMSDNITQRWSGSTLVEISKSITTNSARDTGTTTTAYRSDFGAANYADIVALGSTKADKTELANYVPLAGNVTIGGPLYTDAKLLNTAGHVYLDLNYTNDNVKNALLYSADNSYIFSSMSFYAPSATNLGTNSAPWNKIYGTIIYQNGNQVANVAQLGTQVTYDDSTPGVLNIITK